MFSVIGYELVLREYVYQHYWILRLYLCLLCVFDSWKLLLNFSQTCDEGRAGVHYVHHRNTGDHDMCLFVRRVWGGRGAPLSLIHQRAPLAGFFVVPRHRIKLVPKQKTVERPGNISHLVAHPPPRPIRLDKLLNVDKWCDEYNHWQISRCRSLWPSSLMYNYSYLAAV